MQVVYAPRAFAVVWPEASPAAEGLGPVLPETPMLWRAVTRNTRHMQGWVFEPSAAAPPPPPPPTRRVTLEMRTPTGGKHGGLAGLRFAFWDSTDFPALLGAPPVQTGTVPAANGDGVATIELPNSTLGIGEAGWLITSNSNGDPEQDPAPLGFAAPVVVQ